MNAARIFDRVLDAGIIFLILFTPLAFGSVHIWAYTIMEIVVFSLLILWAAKNLFARQLSLDRALVPLYLSFALFLIYSFLQTVTVPPDVIKTLSPKAYELYSLVIPGFAGTGAGRSLSVYPYATKIELIKFIAYFGAFFLITQEMRDEKRIKKLVLAFIVVGFFEALYGLYGYFSNDPYIFGFKNIYYKDSATGTFINRNHFAGYLGISVFLAMGYLLARVPGAGAEHYGIRQRLFDFLNTARATKGALLLVAVTTMVLGIAFSLSRMGVFSLTGALLFIAFMTMRDKKARFANVLFAVLSVSLVATLWYGLDPLEERYYHTSDDLFNNRAVVWKATGKLINDYPLTGTGFGTYRNVFQRYKPDDFIGNLSISEHAHNDYIEMFVEVGVIGFLPVAFGVIYFPVILFLKLSKRKDPVARGICLGGMGSMAYMALHSIADFNMHIPSNALALFIAMAIAYCAAVTRRKHRHEKR